MTGTGRTIRIRAIRFLILIGLFLVSTLCSVRADFVSDHGAVVEPNSPYFTTVFFDGHDLCYAYVHVCIGQIVYADGYVQPLDTSQGNHYTLTFTSDGKTTILTQFDPSNVPVDQWISDAN